MTIYFYGAKEKPYDCFSNFSYYGFELDGHFWKTCEHFFQAQKFIGTPHYEEIRLLDTPKEAAYRGREYPLRPDWKETRYEIMLRGVLKKFETHADIRQTLLDTGEEEIVENNPRDNIWANGPDGNGSNLMGKVLMEVRSILKQRTVN